MRAFTGHWAWFPSSLVYHHCPLKFDGDTPINGHTILCYNTHKQAHNIKRCCWSFQLAILVITFVAASFALVASGAPNTLKSRLCNLQFYISAISSFYPTIYCILICKHTNKRVCMYMRVYTLTSRVVEQT